jgi:hypothetical protein
MTRLKRQFLRYNNAFFGGALDPDMRVTWSSRLGKGVMGDYDSEQIRIAAALKPFVAAWKLTLLHEMAHAATDTERAEHGPRWNREMRRLYRLGAFDSLW